MGKKQAVGGHAPLAEEGRLSRLLSDVGEEGIEQLGDLTQLAQGDLGMSAQTRSYVDGAYESQRKQAFEDYQNSARLMRGELSKRGRSDSTIEDAAQGTVARGYAQSLSDIESQRSRTMFEMPLKTAGVQLGANQALMERLGLLGQEREYDLQERLARYAGETQVRASDMGPTEAFASGLSSASRVVRPPNG